MASLVVRQKTSTQHQNNQLYPYCDNWVGRWLLPHLCAEKSWAEQPFAFKGQYWPDLRAQTALPKPRTFADSGAECALTMSLGGASTFSPTWNVWHVKMISLLTSGQENLQLYWLDSILIFRTKHMPFMNAISIFSFFFKSLYIDSVAVVVVRSSSYPNCPHSIYF